jgi:hypothetical protein
LGWGKTFGESSDDNAWAVRQTIDGGYILAGYTYSFGAGDKDAWLIKTDADGNKVWDNTFGGSNGEHAYDMQQTSDEGYILAGYTESYGAGNGDAWLIKSDANGNKVWDKTFGGSGWWDEADAVQQTSDGGYILAGGTYSYGAGGEDAWLIKTDEIGNTCDFSINGNCSVNNSLWVKTFGGGSDDRASAVQQTSDGGYILAGYTLSYGAGYGDAWLIKTDEDGNKVWDKTFGGIDFDAVQAVQQTSDGGYILAGATKSFGAGGWDIWLIKTNANGNKVWDKTFGGSFDDCAYTVRQTSDGGYILAGNTKSYGAGGQEIWLIKTDTKGNKIWDKTYGGSLDEDAYTVRQTSDGGYILAGDTYSYGAGGRDAWLIKTDANGNAPSVPTP